jgi:hypothetical protein
MGRRGIIIIIIITITITIIITPFSSPFSQALRPDGRVGCKRGVQDKFL